MRSSWLRRGFTFRAVVQEDVLLAHKVCALAFLAQTVDKFFITTLVLRTEEYLA
jgi:hypothetical protein